MNKISNIEIEVKMSEMSGNGPSGNGNGNGNGMTGNGLEPMSAQEFESLLKDFS